MQDHIAKCENLKSQEVTFSVHYLVAIGIYDDVIVCTTSKKHKTATQSHKTEPMYHNFNDIFGENAFFGCHGN